MRAKTGKRNGRRMALPGVRQETGFTPDCLEQVRGCLSQNTERALRADLKVFSHWCAIRGLQDFPASTQTLARFVESAAVEKSPATVRRYVSSIASLHKLAGLENPAAGRETRLALKRMKMQTSSHQRQALGLTSQKCERLLAATGDRLIDVRDRALLRVAYDAMLRRSELVSLEVSDLLSETDGSGTLLVRLSKTDRQGDGALLYLSPKTMQTAEEWMKRANVRTGRLFRSVSLNGTVGDSLDASQVPRIYRKMAREAGLDEDVVRELSGHSARVGATQDMIASGIELPMVMQAGRWTSPAMVARYGARLLARRSGTARLARLRGPGR